MSRILSLRLIHAMHALTSIYIEVNECILFFFEISSIIILVKNEDNESMGCLYFNV